ncbi:hypothetical protein FIBSPDRAFT_936252 [Athelia psychrophila]|uniref:Uncharacterized protein n=1 Tax=Athelia psychrophila TaxID=1759441 RepID=A0A166CGP2_9AGAM|nr:hypothetical protein FIBSPDRAFT_936252 [Fibularhizoctonia sp. CBS 109695]
MPTGRNRRRIRVTLAQLNSDEQLEQIPGGTQARTERRRFPAYLSMIQQGLQSLRKHDVQLSGVAPTVLSMTGQQGLGLLESWRPVTELTRASNDLPLMLDYTVEVPQLDGSPIRIHGPEFRKPSIPSCNITEAQGIRTHLHIHLEHCCQRDVVGEAIRCLRLGPVNGGSKLHAVGCISLISLCWPPVMWSGGGRVYNWKVIAAERNGGWPSANGAVHQSASDCCYRTPCVTYTISSADRPRPWSEQAPGSRPLREPLQSPGRLGAIGLDYDG